MCYDISFKTDAEKLKEYFPAVELNEQLQMNFNVPHLQAQSYSVFPVVISEDDAYTIKLFEWGVIASYMDTEEKIKKQRSWMCNARAEKMLDHSSYWYRIKNNRCLIPVTGIFEHRSVKGFRNKIPYHVRWRNRQMFCIPGLYNYSPLPDEDTGELTGTFTVITTKANSLMENIHNDGENKHRMPLFLPKELELEWLKPDLTEKQINDILSFQASSEDLEAWTVSTIRTQKERTDGKEKYEPFEWPGLPGLGNDDGKQP